METKYKIGATVYEVIDPRNTIAFEAIIACKFIGQKIEIELDDEGTIKEEIVMFIVDYENFDGKGTVLPDKLFGTKEEARNAAIHLLSKAHHSSEERTEKYRQLLEHLQNTPADQFFTYRERIKD